MRSEWWNIMAAEVARRLYVGELQPPLDSNALRKAMIDWLASGGHFGTSSPPEDKVVRPFFAALAHSVNCAAAPDKRS